MFDEKIPNCKVCLTDIVVRQHYSKSVNTNRSIEMFKRSNLYSDYSLNCTQVYKTQKTSIKPN
jgi:hypothetical protein